MDRSLTSSATTAKPRPASPARADVYRQLDCPQGERYDLEHALLFCDEDGLRLKLSERLRKLARTPAVH